MSVPKSIIVPAAGLIDVSRADTLQLYRYRSAADLANAASAVVASEIRSLISTRKRAIGIFASDPSLGEFLDELSKEPDLSWTRVIGFQLAEYLALGEDSPGSFRQSLLTRLVKRIPMAEFHPIRGEAVNPQAVCRNYSDLLKAKPPDFAVLGIGENGELGLLKAADCDANETAAVKIVDLFEERRRAITLTVSTIMRCESLFAILAGPEEETIKRVIETEIGPACPASILRAHPNAHLFLEY